MRSNAAPRPIWGRQPSATRRWRRPVVTYMLDQRTRALDTLMADVAADYQQATQRLKRMRPGRGPNHCLPRRARNCDETNPHDHYRHVTNLPARVADRARATQHKVAERAV